MISTCYICKENKQCSHVNVPLCRDHYMIYNDVVRQNREASLVSQNEMRELGIGDRRKEPRNAQA